MTDCAFPNHRQAALALLNSATKFSRKEGGFLGNVAVQPSPLTAKQEKYLSDLLKRAEFPPLGGEVAS